MRALLSCFVLLLCTTQAFASLLVTPSRISFDERDRTHEVIVMNTSNKTNSYVLEWTNQSQTPFGAYKPLEGDELDAFPTADEYIRFSPRRVTLRPGESQTVKLLVRRKNGMDMPEYRSHLKFTALPSEKTNSPEAPSSTTDGINIKLNLLLSYSIPVVLRTEAPLKTVEISQLTFQPSTEAAENGSVALKVSKPTNNSLFGDFTVFHDANGVSKAVGFLNGVNIFAENKEFIKSIALVEAVEINSGNLRLEYKGRAEFADTVLAESTIALQ